jgi:hypothetical protein
MAEALNPNSTRLALDRGFHGTNFAPRPLSQRATDQNPINQEDRSTGLVDMEDIAKTAQTVLDYIKTDNREVSGFVRGFIENVRKYAQKAQQGDTKGMTRVLEALGTINKRLDGLL